MRKSERDGRFHPVLFVYLKKRIKKFKKILEKITVI